MKKTILIITIISISIIFGGILVTNAQINPEIEKLETRKQAAIQLEQIIVRYISIFENIEGREENLKRLNQLHQLIKEIRSNTKEELMVYHDKQTPSDFACGDSVIFTYNNETVTYGTVEGQNNTCWLDRNLGASRVATSSTDSQAYGDLFQWGRGDDGHQNRASSTTSTLSDSDNPGHSNFILSTIGDNWDWRSSLNNNLWQGVNGINNPCPDGWRVPTETELDEERQSWSQNNSAGAFASDLKWTTAGRRSRNTGSLFSVGSGGFYWSSSVSGSTARRLSFGSGGAFMGSFTRALGGSVRCLRD